MREGGLKQLAMLWSLLLVAGPLCFVDIFPFSQYPMYSTRADCYARYQIVDSHGDAVASPSARLRIQWGERDFGPGRAPAIASVNIFGVLPKRDALLDTLRRELPPETFPLSVKETRSCVKNDKILQAEAAFSVAYD